MLNSLIPNIFYSNLDLETNEIMNCEQNNHFDGKIKETIQINDLPIEVLVIIFSFLDIKSLCTIERGMLKEVLC